MNSFPNNLTLEQQFQMQLMKESAKNMSREQALDLLVQAARLLMVKDNVINNLEKQGSQNFLGYQGGL